MGEAPARALAAAGFETVSAARRVERCEALAAEGGGRAIELDVTDPESVERLVAELPVVDAVVPSAGGGAGVAPVGGHDEDHWRAMFESNVLGVARVTKTLLPALREGTDPIIVIVGSVAGVEVYEGGAGYTAAKHGAHAGAGQA